MTLLEMKIQVANHLGMLATDGTTILDGKQTATGIVNDINYVYRETIFPRLSDLFPDDFVQSTYPINTYTATGTVDATSTGTTLVSTSAVFSNAMEGFQVYNSTDDEFATIETYNSSTSVTLDTTIDDDWDGDTFYVLGNEYAFGGSAEDLKDILGVAIKYSSTDTNYTEANPTRKHKVIWRLQEHSTGNPKWYPTTVDVLGVPTKGIGIVPYPTNYNGKIQIIYVEKPPALSNDSDTPTLDVTGISEAIVNGAIARGKRVLNKFDEAANYEELDPILRIVLPKGTRSLIKSYRPMTRGKAQKNKPSRYYSAMQRRNI